MLTSPRNNPGIPKVCRFTAGAACIVLLVVALPAASAQVLIEDRDFGDASWNLNVSSANGDCSDEDFVEYAGRTTAAGFPAPSGSFRFDHTATADCTPFARAFHETAIPRLSESGSYCMSVDSMVAVSGGVQPGVEVALIILDEGTGTISTAASVAANAQWRTVSQNTRAPQSLIEGTGPYRFGINVAVQRPIVGLLGGRIRVDNFSVYFDPTGRCDGAPTDACSDDVWLSATGDAATDRQVALSGEDGNPAPAHFVSQESVAAADDDTVVIFDHGGITLSGAGCGAGLVWDLRTEGNPALSYGERLVARQSGGWVEVGDTVDDPASGDWQTYSLQATEAQLVEAGINTALPFEMGFTLQAGSTPTPGGVWIDNLASREIGGSGSCDPPTCAASRQCAVDSDCSDRLFCNGVEACNESGECTAGTPPECGSDSVCDEEGDACVATPDPSCTADIAVWNAARESLGTLPIAADAGSPPPAQEAAWSALDGAAHVGRRITIDGACGVGLTFDYRSDPGVLCSSGSLGVFQKGRFRKLPVQLPAPGVHWQTQATLIHTHVFADYGFDTTQGLDLSFQLACIGGSTYFDNVAFGPVRDCNAATLSCSDIGTACTEDRHCDDGLTCNGAEECNIGAGVCLPGDAITCSASQTCSEAIGACVCVASETCGTACCPENSVCTDATAGTCACAAGFAQGADGCVPECEVPGQCPDDPPCASDADCASDRICDDTTLTCVYECTVDADCSGTNACIERACVVECGSDADCPDTAVCDASLKTCGPECRKDADCNGTEVCDLISQTCGPECEADQHCSLGQRCRRSTHTCEDVRCVGDEGCSLGEVCRDNICETQCLSDTDCPGTLACDDSGLCSPLCVGDSECDGATTCSSFSLTCTPECGDDLDCGGALRCSGGVCAPECTDNSDCPGDFVCDRGSLRCRPNCTADNECPVGSVCASDGTCLVSCTSNTDCDSEFACDTDAEVCVPGCEIDGSCETVCLSERDCGAGERCSPERVCVSAGCTSDLDCNGTLECQPDGRCGVQCELDADCGAGERCDPVLSICAPECATRLDCEGAQVCVGGACVMECSTDSDCTGAEICDPLNFTCRSECVTEDDCSGSEICALGRCVFECASSSDCAAGRACDLTERRCVPACIEDIDCEAGRRCEAAGFCAQPCLIDAECDGAERCDRSSGRCTPECTSDADCGSEVCNDSLECEPECADDADCPGASVCRVQSATCGPRCLYDDDCGPGLACSSALTCSAECLRNSECFGTEICDGGRCRAECAENGDCAPGLVCVPSTRTCEPPCVVDEDCPDGSCRRATGVCTSSCGGSTGCSGGQVCAGAAGCVPACTSNRDCTGAWCDRGSLTCRRECFVDSDCGASEVCNEDGRCSAACMISADCAVGECFNGRCVNTCGDAEDCSDEELCLAGQCRSECVFDDDCPGGAVCEGNRCIGDSDGDGISNSVEIALGGDPNQADSDGDGFCDGLIAVPGQCRSGEDLVGMRDTDGDLIPDALDADDDDDGVPTATELAVSTEPYLADSDHDGLCDGPGRTGAAALPCVGGESGEGAGSGLDTDGDGTINALDIDDDDDGILTAVEVSDTAALSAGLGIAAEDADLDGDGLNNWVDVDADGDSADPSAPVADGNDGGLGAGRGDCSGNGVPNYLDDQPCAAVAVDSDLDGVVDRIDNCPFSQNAGQEDCDGDGSGDVCDLEGDREGQGRCVNVEPEPPADTDRGCSSTRRPAAPTLFTGLAVVALLARRRRRR